MTAAQYITRREELAAGFATTTARDRFHAAADAAIASSANIASAGAKMEEAADRLLHREEKAEADYIAIMSDWAGY